MKWITSIKQLFRSKEHRANMLLYRQILCCCLGGLDNYEERRMVADLIDRIDRRGLA